MPNVDNFYSDFNDKEKVDEIFNNIMNELENEVRSSLKFDIPESINYHSKKILELKNEIKQLNLRKQEKLNELKEKKESLVKIQKHHKLKEEYYTINMRKKVINFFNGELWGMIKKQRIVSEEKIESFDDQFPQLIEKVTETYYVPKKLWLGKFFNINFNKINIEDPIILNQYNDYDDVDSFFVYDEYSKCALANKINELMDKIKNSSKINYDLRDILVTSEHEALEIINKFKEFEPIVESDYYFDNLGSGGE